MNIMVLAFPIIFGYLVWFAGAIQIDCDKTDQIHEDQIHHCCKHPDGHNQIMADCAKEHGFKLPNSNEQSMMDLTAGHAIAGTCFAKCVFDKLNFMKDDNLDMEAVKKSLLEKHSDDPEYVNEMIRAFNHCHGKVEENAAKFMSNPIFKHMTKDFCEPKSAVIMACVIRQFFHNCPSFRWAKTEECENLLQFSRNCTDSIATL
ncbi:general odorant-binding protein 68 [Drosophila grimshawi]|uniref:general odorant-binding protein 68 n=1 Tax=Drosophila grimshawi TaxID=7222 RepID=UPI001C935F38|nr:general odorant-binding protein 68 [Drosophila grimshawi]